MDKLYIPGDLVYFGGEKAEVWFRNPSADDSIYVRVIKMEEKIEYGMLHLKRKLALFHSLLRF